MGFGCFERPIPNSLATTRSENYEAAEQSIRLAIAALEHAEESAKVAKIASFS